MGEDPPPPHLKKIALCSHQGLMVWVGVVFSLSLLSIFVYVTERLGKYVDFIIIRGGGAYMLPSLQEFIARLRHCVIRCFFYCLNYLY